jgi:2-hydroxy-3-keto-5-methylthiopentenyl-1-phosphate phosphatase
MPTTGNSGTVVQCDFDGTVTYEDVGLRILEVFADGDWKRIFGQYRRGEISVGRFNTDAFALVNNDKTTLLRFVRKEVRIRDGFLRLVEYCRKHGFRLIIVSNGLDFYIKEVISRLRLTDLEIFAARTIFTANSINTFYIGPDDSVLMDSFKESYAQLFLNEGYRLIYIGNGPSDLEAARLADHVFATGSLVEQCGKHNLGCVPFDSMDKLIDELKHLD